jgi:CheY-like chemotaxis protein
MSDKTILIVEDNPVNRELLEAILEANDYEHLSAEDGAIAVDLAAAHLPDLILMDIHMGGMDGYAALEKIRQNPDTVGIPVIAITGNATHDDRMRMDECGFNDVIIKPYGIDEVLSAVSSYL